MDSLHAQITELFHLYQNSVSQDAVQQELNIAFQGDNGLSSEQRYWLSISSTPTLAKEFNKAGSCREKHIKWLARAFRDPVGKSLSTAKMNMELLRDSNLDQKIADNLVASAYQSTQFLVWRMQDILANYRLFTENVNSEDVPVISRTLASIERDYIPALNSLIKSDCSLERTNHSYAEGSEHLFPIPQESWRQHRIPESIK